MRVRFIGGGEYDYENVPRAVFNDVKGAPSIGKAINELLRPHYDSVRVADGHRIVKSRGKK
jgi:hypothetical protein